MWCRYEWCVSTLTRICRTKFTSIQVGNEKYAYLGQKKIDFMVISRKIRPLGAFYSPPHPLPPTTAWFILKTSIFFGGGGLMLGFWFHGILPILLGKGKHLCSIKISQLKKNFFSLCIYFCLIVIQYMNFI